MSSLVQSQFRAPFRGRFEIKLDPKGRLSLPTAYRQTLPALHAELVVTNSRYRNRSCLDVYSQPEWEKLEARMAKLPNLNTNVQAFTRFYLSAGQSLEIDAQNRILVPQGLRRFASLENQVVLIGLGNKFEIWSQEGWNAISEQLSETFEATMSAVAALEGEEGGS